MAFETAALVPPPPFPHRPKLAWVASARGMEPEDPSGNGRQALEGLPGVLVRKESSRPGANSGLRDI